MTSLLLLTLAQGAPPPLDIGTALQCLQDRERIVALERVCLHKVYEISYEPPTVVSHFVIGDDVEGAIRLCAEFAKSSHSLYCAPCSSEPPRKVVVEGGAVE
jgi:hypothetical protein